MRVISQSVTLFYTLLFLLPISFFSLSFLCLLSLYSSILLLITLPYFLHSPWSSLPLPPSSSLLLPPSFFSLSPVPPAITSHPPPFHEIRGNRPLTFTVEFQSRFRENTTVTWYQDGRALPEGRSQTQYSSEQAGRTTLQFNPITRSDRGVYRVVVRNSFGIIPLQLKESETSFQISIIGESWFSIYVSGEFLHSIRSLFDNGPSDPQRA